MIRKTIKHILIPINFSEKSKNAIRTGIAMCIRHGADLHLLFVKKENKSIIPPGKNPQLLGIILEAETALQRRLEAQAKAIQRKHHINCYYHTAQGTFSPAVASVANDFYCDLIILEKNRNAKPFSWLKTNSVYEILKKVSCPVLSLPPDRSRLNFKKILFPIRALPKGLQKLEIALPIIKENNSKVVLFGSVRNKKRHSDSEIVDELIAKANSLITNSQMSVENEVNITEDVAKEVVNKAVEKKSDLIIISASIKKGLKSVFVSNYTERIIENSPVPVLSVKIS